MKNNKLGSVIYYCNFIFNTFSEVLMKYCLLSRRVSMEDFVFINIDLLHSILNAYICAFD